MIERIYSRPSIDWLLAAATVVVLWACGVIDRLHQTPADAQRAAFLSTGGLLGILAGFTVTVTFFFATTESKSLERFRRDYGRELNRSFIGVFVVYAAAAGVAIAAGLAVPDVRGAWLYLSACSLAAIKMGRIMLFTKGMLDARYRDARLQSVVVPDKPERRRAG